MNQPTSTNESLSDKITYDDDYGCSEPEEVIRVVDVKEAVKKLKEYIKTHSVHKVMNGNASPELLRECRFWEETGREDERQLVLETIDKIFGEKLC